MRVPQLVHCLVLHLGIAGVPELRFWDVVECYSRCVTSDLLTAALAS